MYANDHLLAFLCACAYVSMFPTIVMMAPRHTHTTSYSIQLVYSSSKCNTYILNIWLHTWNKNRNSVLQGTKICHPKIWLFSKRIILGWWILRNKRLRCLSFYPSLTYLKNLDREPRPGRALCMCMLVSQSSPALRPQELYPTSLLYPWNSPGKNAGVGCHFLLQGSSLGLQHCRWILYHLSLQGSQEGALPPAAAAADAALSPQSGPTLCNTVDCSLPGSSVHGTLEARILEWIAMPSSGDLPDPGIEPGSPASQADSLLLLPPETSTKNMGWMWWRETQQRPVSHCFWVAQKIFVYQTFVFSSFL